MRYLENALKFIIKYWILAVPLFVLTVIPLLISGTAASVLQLNFQSFFSDPAQFTNPGNIISMLPKVLPAIAGGGFLAFLFQFVSIPATYGLVNKGLETGNTGLNDIGQAVSLNFVKYIMYFIGIIVLVVVSIIAFIIISIILGLLVAILKSFGLFLMFLIFLAIFVAIIVAAVLLSMWLSAMVVDDLEIIAAAKRSFEIVKSCFWTVLGITILVAVACGIAGWILSLLAFIPLLGPIIAGIVPTVQTFVMLTFLLIVYREKTGRTNTIS